jgi:hypothetical protein
MSFYIRSEKHDILVNELMIDFRDRGYKVFKTGQESHGEEYCRCLSKFPTGWERWKPDISYFKGDQRGFIDAKTTLDKNKGTANHSVEASAVRSAIGWVAYTECSSYYFVWEDRSLIKLRNLCNLIDMKNPITKCDRTIASGKDYFLFDKINCSPFDSVFENAKSLQQEV